MGIQVGRVVLSVWNCLTCYSMSPKDEDANVAINSSQMHPPLVCLNLGLKSRIPLNPLNHHPYSMAISWIYGYTMVYHL